MILAHIKSVLNSDWADILERTPDIKNKSYDEITEVMLGAFLERHPLVVQRRLPLSRFRKCSTRDIGFVPSAYSVAI